MSEFTEDLIDQVKTKYRNLIKADKSIGALIEKIEKSSDYALAYKYAVKLGDKMGISLSEVFQGLQTEEGTLDVYYGTAMEVLEPTLAELHAEVSKKCQVIQANKNAKDGMRIKAQAPKLDEFNIREIARLITAAETVKAIQENINHFSQKTVDASIEGNAEFANSLGYKIVVTRTYDDVGNHDGNDVCNFCKEREGTKEFDSWADSKGDEIFQRHAGCECTIEYSVGGSLKNKIRNYKRN